MNLQVGVHDFQMFAIHLFAAGLLIRIVAAVLRGLIQANYPLFHC